MPWYEVNLFGVYVAPISIMVLAAWVLLVAIRRLAWRYSLLRHVWHPALFTFAVYVMLLSCIVLLVGA